MNILWIYWKIYMNNYKLRSNINIWNKKIGFIKFDYVCFDKVFWLNLNIIKYDFRIFWIIKIFRRRNWNIFVVLWWIRCMSNVYFLLNYMFEEMIMRILILNILILILKFICLIVILVVIFVVMIIIWCYFLGL